MCALGVCLHCLWSTLDFRIIKIRCCIVECVSTEIIDRRAKKIVAHQYELYAGYSVLLIVLDYTIPLKVSVNGLSCNVGQRFYY